MYLKLLQSSRLQFNLLFITRADSHKALPLSAVELCHLCPCVIDSTADLHVQSRCHTWQEQVLPGFM